MRTLFVCILITIGSITVSAQVAIGFKGGVNLAKWTNLDIYSKIDGSGFLDEFLVGANIGLVSEVNLYRNLFLQVELSFVQKGYRPKEFVGPNISTSFVRFDLNVLEFSVLPKYKYTWDSFGVFVLAGPSIGYFLNGKETQLISNVGQVTVGEEIDLPLDSDTYNRIEWSLHLGAGVFVPVKESIEVFFDARYAVGLTDINNDPILLAYLKDGKKESGHRNWGIGLTVGALFDL